MLDQAAVAGVEEPRGCAELAFLAATAEWLNLHVSLETRSVCPWPPEILASFIDIAETQGKAAMPAEVGKIIRVPKPLYSLSTELLHE